MKQIFHAGDSLLPKLVIDMVFVEELRPVLFSCRDNDGKLYICSRFRVNAKLTEWVVARTEAELIIALLNGIITMHNIFTLSKELWIRTKKADNTVQVKRFLLTPDTEWLLPTNGYSIEAEPGEFNEEIIKLCGYIYSAVKRPFDDF